MVLPINEKEMLEKVIKDRPGDEVYQEIKPFVEKIESNSQTFRARILDLLVEDSIKDLALAESLDDMGKVIEYHAQNNSIERPVFSGEQVINLSRKIGQLLFAIKLAEILGANEEIIDRITNAEISRLWGDDKRYEPKETKKEQTVLKLPDEIASLLKQVIKTNTTNKKGSK